MKAIPAIFPADLETKPPVEPFVDPAMNEHSDAGRDAKHREIHELPPIN